MLQRVHALAGGVVECRVMGHCGHDSSGNLNRGAVFGLDEQLEHHESWLRSRLLQEPELRVVLCGHSVGAYIVLRIMRSLLGTAEAARIAKSVLLFPTLMHIADTPNGRQHERAVRCRCLYASLAGCMTCILPRCCRHACIRWADDTLIEEDIPLAERFIRYNSVNNALYMYSKEAEAIKELDHETLTAYANRLLVYHGSTDGWAPLSYRDYIMSAAPSVRVVTDPNGIPHAFASRYSNEIAQVCWQEISSLIEPAELNQNVGMSEVSRVKYDLESRTCCTFTDSL